MVSTSREYILYTTKPCKQGKVKERLVAASRHIFTLRAARAARQQIIDDRYGRRSDGTTYNLLIPGIMRIPAGLEGAGVTDWLSGCIEFPKVFTRKGYLVIDEMDGDEIGVQWIVGVFPTIKAVQERAPQKRVIVVYHPQRKEVELDQPPPVTPDIWSVE